MKKKRLKETKTKKEEKYYVVRPIQESHFDRGFRIVGTKDDIAEFTKLQVEDSMETKELDFQPINRQSMVLVESHVGNREGTEGIGGSKVCKTMKEAHKWMVERIKETQVEAPTYIIFALEPIYWVSKTWLEKKKKFEEILEDLK